MGTMLRIDALNAFVKGVAEDVAALIDAGTESAQGFAAQSGVELDDFQAQCVLGYGVLAVVAKSMAEAEGIEVAEVLARVARSAQEVEIAP